MQYIQSGRLNVIIDGQWGSTGKGLLAGWLYDKHPGIVAGVCDFMPNAGHTVFMPSGHKFVSRQLPIAVAFGRIGLIGPHAAVDLDVLREEVLALRGLMADGEYAVPEIFVHPLASVVRREDRAAETVDLARIASTAKGGHRATVRKIMRAGDALLARDFVGDFASLGVRVADTRERLQLVLANGGTALAETAQGFDLGLTHGTAWPYVTGRDCLVGRALDNAGASVRDVGSIIGCLRSFPIRVGNTEEGHSGPHYADQRELSWDEVSVFAGRPVIEKTTVTGRTRRVFSFSHSQLRRFLTFCRPDYCFLNFYNYLDGVTAQERAEFLLALGETLRNHGSRLGLLGRGPGLGDVEMATEFGPL